MRGGRSDPVATELVEPDGWRDPVSTAVVEAVATVSNARVEAMPPLFDVVDPEALDRLFTQTRTGMVSFRYCGVTVRVRADGRISIYEGDEWDP